MRESSQKGLMKLSIVLVAAGCGCAALLILFICLAGLAGILIPHLNSMREEARGKACAANLEQIGMALKQYASGNDGNYPPFDDYRSFELLLKDGYVKDAAIFVCPSSGIAPAKPGDGLSSHVAYLFRGCLSADDGPEEWLAMDMDRHHGKTVNVLFADGHVESLLSDDE